MNEFKFKEVIDKTMVHDSFRTSFRETMFYSVLENTVNHKDTQVTPEYLACMKEVFDNFANASKITITVYDKDKKNIIRVKTFEFGCMDYNRTWCRMAILLLNNLNEYNIWFEDTIENGFCCLTNDYEETYSIDVTMS